MPYPTAEDAEHFPWVSWHNPLSTGDRSPALAAIPIATGLALAGAYDAVGLAIVVFAPPPLKPIGVIMLAPGPSELILFGIGYYIGDQFVQTYLE